MNVISVVIAVLLFSPYLAAGIGNCLSDGCLQKTDQVLLQTRRAITGMPLLEESDSASLEGATYHENINVSQALELVSKIYVINMESQLQRYEDFVDHMSKNVGIEGSRITRFLGFNATDENLGSELVTKLIPNIDLARAKDHNRGNAGAGLAHLSLWHTIAESDECHVGDSQMEKFALVFEDDERPRDAFVPALASILNAAVQSVRSVPDFINLNVLRPKGEVITGLSLPGTIELLKVSKSQRAHIGLRPNVWLAAYLVRCSSAAALLDQLGKLQYNQDTWNGVSPVLDVAFSDFLVRPENDIISWIVSPTNIISEHIEGTDSRKELNKELLLEHAGQSLVSGTMEPSR